VYWQTNDALHEPSRARAGSNCKQAPTRGAHAAQALALRERLRCGSACAAGAPALRVTKIQNLKRVSDNKFYGKIFLPPRHKDTKKKIK